MSNLFVLSIASGYGGAERDLELLMQHLPTGTALHLYAENGEHHARLASPGVLPGGARLIRLAATGTLASRRIAALRLVFDYLCYRPQSILLNTQASALIAAMAAKYLPEIGKRCHIFVHDFLWDELPYVFGRLTGARVLVPDSCVIERCGYLAPFYVEPFGAFPYAVLPSPVTLPHGPVCYNGPILHLATVNPWKGHVDLLMAIHQLKESGHALQLRSVGMVGNYALRQRLDCLVDHLHLADCVVLDDYLPDPGPMLQSCRAVVVSSVSHSGGPETFGRSIIEAWAYRKPVVAYATGAPARLITHEVDGLLVPEGDTRALSAALQRVASDSALCQRLGEAGYTKVEQNYQTATVAHRLFRLLAEPNACAN